MCKCFIFRPSLLSDLSLCRLLEPGWSVDPSIFDTALEILLVFDAGDFSHLAIVVGIHEGLASSLLA